MEQVKFTQMKDGDRPRPGFWPCEALKEPLNNAPFGISAKSLLNQRLLRLKPQHRHGFHLPITVKAAGNGVAISAHALKQQVIAV
jgi:hypothetical protein